MLHIENMITDTHDVVKYKIVGTDGKEIAIRQTQMAAEMYLDQLPEELREGCKIIPITGEGQQLLFG